jgi:tetrahydromethanopterin S-methyltransferase subunit D
MRDWALYGLVTPLLIGIGAAVVAYASQVLSLLRRLQRNQRRPAGQEGGIASPAYEETGGALLARRTAGVFVYVMIAVSIFWINATRARYGLSASVRTTVFLLLFSSDRRQLREDVGRNEEAHK